jgi:hypothetical protein
LGKIEDKKEKLGNPENYSVLDDYEKKKTNMVNTENRSRTIKNE